MLALAWSPDARLLASGGMDAEVLVWEAEEKRGGDKAEPAVLRVSQGVNV